MDLLLTHGSFLGGSCHVGIQDGRIAYIGSEKVDAAETIHLRGGIILPGMIDPHVHMRDLGMARKETWKSGSQAALAGGVTTVLDMPNTAPPLVSCSSYDIKKEAAASSAVNYGFHAGVEGTSLIELKSLLAHPSRPVSGVKLFLAETSSNQVTTSPEFLCSVMETAASWGKPVLFHCEGAACLDEYKRKYADTSYNDIRYHNRIRDPRCEGEALAFVIDLVKRTGAATYICHVSTREGYELIRQAREDGLPLFIESTPHHCFLSEKDIQDSGNFAKVNPPVRSETDRSYMNEMLVSGGSDALGSDHAPHTIEEKDRDYFNAPSGIPGLETSYHLMIDQMIRGNISAERVMRLCAENPARIFSIQDRGKIEEGMMADIVIVDPEYLWTVEPDKFYTKGKYSPFAGREMRGKVVMTLVNGRVAYRDGEIVNTASGCAVEYA